MLRAVFSRLTRPGTWLVIGLFALVSGLGFVQSLNQFIDESAQALAVPPPIPVNINQQLIRPFFLQVGLAALLALPLLTAGTYARLDAGPNRLGPAWRVAVGMFLTTFVLYGLMLLTTACLVAVLFVYGSPEWASIVTGYLGLLLMGAAFISVALFIASLTTNAMAAGVATCAISLAIGGAAWLARSAVPGARAVFQHISLADALDDFAKGIVDTGHVLVCVSMVTLGLFLTIQALAALRAADADSRA